MHDDFDKAFLIFWIIGIVFTILFWGGVIALGFYAVNAFS
jgi:hypothetical protein